MMTGNEYAVLSNVPMSDKEREKHGGDSSSVEVPRQCAIKIGSEGVPVSMSYVQQLFCSTPCFFAYSLMGTYLHPIH